MTKESCHVRRARRDELAWINEQYREVGFLPSTDESSLLAIAEIDGERAGIGRLETIDETSQELGGMYVLEKFRGKKVANAIVTYLLKHRDENAKVYCLPFAHLSKLYQSLGFRPCTELAAVPKKIREKREWCKTTYPEDVLLFIFD